jgi:hypothetical protein
MLNGLVSIHLGPKIYASHNTSHILGEIGMTYNPLSKPFHPEQTLCFGHAGLKYCILGSV